MQGSQKAHALLTHASAQCTIDIAIIIGYIIFGQMKTDTDFSALENYVRDLGLDVNEMKTYYDIIAFFNPVELRAFPTSPVCW